MAKKKKEYKPLSYVKPTAVNPVSVSKPGKYKSALHNKISNTRKQLMNWKYNPLQDASYQALAQIYGARGEQAAADTLGEAASLNGGFGTSYAVSAAQQARNQYNQELASLIPDLEQNAYNRLQSNYQMLVDRDNDLYTRYRDKMADYQWGKDFNSGLYQWGKDYDTGVYQYKQEQKKNSSGGGGRRGRRGGGYYGGGYGGDAGGSGSIDGYYNAAESLVKVGEGANAVTNGLKNALSSGIRPKKKKKSNPGGHIVK